MSSVRQNSNEVLPSVPFTKNGALAFLRVDHAPRTEADEVVEDEASSRHRDETLADNSKPAFTPVRSGLWTVPKSLNIITKYQTSNSQ